MRAFKLAIFLTTLFLSVMPLSTAYADETKSCSGNRVEDFTNDKALMAQLTEQHGKFVILDEKQSTDFVNRASEEFGQRPPYDIRSILMVFPSSDAENINLAYFDADGCMVGTSHLPAEIVLKFVGKDS